MPLVNRNPQEQQLRALLLKEGWTLHQRFETASSLKASAPQIDFEAWRQVVAPDFPGNFQKRLIWDDLDEYSASWAFNPPDESVPQRPNWLPYLDIILQANHNINSDADLQFLSTRRPDLPFVHAWAPVVSSSLARLQAHLAEVIPDLHLTYDAVLGLADALLHRLSNIAAHALWEMFNLRRTPGQILLAHLGNNGEGTGQPVCETYNSFISDLLEHNYAPLLSEYPVLGRLLSEAIRLWFEGSTEMLDRLASKRSDLDSHFGIPASSVLQSIQLGVSDPHCGGRAVAILVFQTLGQHIKIVYKPKDMRIDDAYQSFLTALNTSSDLAPLKILRVLPCDGFGFMEYVEHRICSSDTDLEYFYANAGRLMAILYVLGCSDCHHENLVANGDQLLLIDTETLLEPEQLDLISSSDLLSDGPSPLLLSIHDSVLRLGFLPQWQIEGAVRKDACDISALGIQPPPEEEETRGWIAVNTDGMMPGQSLKPCQLPTSLPVGHGSPQRLTDFVDPLCVGFSTQLNEIIRLKHYLTDSLRLFARLPRRLVPRNTRLYFLIEAQMLEPRSLRSSIAQGLRLEQLSRSYLLSQNRPPNWPMFHAEVKQMELLDIPFFNHTIDSTELPLPFGLPALKPFLNSSGLASATHRLHKLCLADIDFQLQLIRGSIGARHLLSTVDSHTIHISESDHVHTSDGTILQNEASRLGSQLWDEAIRDRDGRPEWLGMDLADAGESFRFGLIGNSFYSGTSGIALLFARLSTSTDSIHSCVWRDRAWLCFDRLAQLASRNDSTNLYRLVRDLPFGLSGLGGILLSLHLLANLGIDEASEFCQVLIDQIRPERLLLDHDIDLIAGVTGLIGPLLTAGSNRSLELSVICGERLLSLQEETGGWSTRVARCSAPLTGFSHGAAGIGAALARLYHISSDERFADGAMRALQYERSVFNPDLGNWPDLRKDGNLSGYMLSWCHGAPGILLSRHVYASSGLLDSGMIAEMEIARRSTIEEAHERLQSRTSRLAHLCCGIFGLTSILRLDALLSSRTLPDLVPDIEIDFIREAHLSGAYTYYSVSNGSISLPGLFPGKAGVALALLESAQGLCCLPAVLSGGLLALPS